eukprot:462304_1
MSDASGYARAASFESNSEYDTDYRMDGGMNQSDLEYDYASSVANSPKKSHHRQSTSLTDVIRAIKEGRGKTALSKRKRLKDNRSIKDWWTWYWQHPVDRFRFVYFLFLLLSSFAFGVYWFMDNDSAFILCGVVGLTMCGYAIYKFKQSIELKKGIDHYKQLNYKLRKENIQLDHAVSRTMKAHELLKQTKSRLAKANRANRENLKKFEQVENNMKIVGQTAKGNLGVVNRMTQELRSSWRDEFLSNERAMLHAVFRRFETKNTNHSNLGLTKDDFKEFQDMLPKRYQQRFERLGTFHNFAGEHSMIDPNDFNNTLDTFALMETDSKDIEFVLTPSVKGQSGHHRDISSFSFTTRDLFGSGVLDSPTMYAHSPQLTPLMSPLTSPPRSPKKGHKQVHFRK